MKISAKIFLIIISFFIATYSFASKFSPIYSQTFTLKDASGLGLKLYTGSEMKCKNCQSLSEPIGYPIYNDKFTQNYRLPTSTPIKGVLHLYYGNPKTDLPYDKMRCLNMEYINFEIGLNGAINFNPDTYRVQGQYRETVGSECKYNSTLTAIVSQNSDEIIITLYK
jgi:hypothetical protein